jgi:prepilin-type processing-associated H-X9-DG protein
MMYAEDNNDLLVNLSTYNEGYGGVVQNGTKVGVPWRAAIQGSISITYPPQTPVNTLAGQIYATERSFVRPVDNRGPANIVNGPLYQYAPYPDVMHCPADFRANLPFGSGYTGLFAWDNYSGSEYLNGENSGGSTWNLSKRMQITRPSQKFIWGESAGMRGEHLGGWALNIARAQANAFIGSAFADSPAAFHGNFADWNFCDGHVEAHKWLNSSTIALANSTIQSKDDGRTDLSNSDAQWVALHYAGAQNP